MLNVTSLTLSAGAGEEAKIILGTPFSIGLKPETGAFEIRHNDQPSFVVTKEGNVEIFGKIRAKGVRLDGSFSFMGVNQWLLAAIEDFNRDVSSLS